MLCYGRRYTAQSLQLSTPSSAVSADHPIALSPGGPTTTDTAAHVTVLETAQTDVTTKFVGSVAVEKNDDHATTYGGPNFIRAMTTEYLMTLKKALCRPVQIGSGVWATTDAVGTDLSSFYIPESLLLQTIFAKKVDGFQGIRGSITLRLQATANPFQQGILKLLFYPMQWFDETYTGRAAAPESWSFWPGVEINLGESTAAELRVPFTIPASFCDLVTTSLHARPQMGAIYVKVYSPLKTGAGTATVGWNLYAHWNEDDLELFNPTPNAYQSGHTKSLSKKSSLPAEAEAKSTSISSSLAAGATIAQIATAVPVLSDIAGPTAWALRVGSRVASALGFSRPQIDEKPRLVTPFPMPYNANVEGPDVSMPLSLTVQPSLKQEPSLGGKTEDEMTIDYFVTKFGFNSTINITASAVAGTNLFNYTLAPFYATVNEAKYPKPMQLMGKLFKYWRGNFRFRIKFVKTKMHTMRLMFVFFPGVTLNQTLATSEYAHREVVDIATIDELVYELPFTAQYPYLNTTNSGIQGSYGSFQILVVNELQAPASVASEIDMVIETAMGEGSEWFEPATLSNLLPTIPIPSLQTASEVKSEAPLRKPVHSAPLLPQAGMTKSLVKVSTLSDAKVTGHQTETAQLCVGEKLLSLRQIIKYASNLSSSFLYLLPLADATGNLPVMFYDPYALGCTTSTGTLSIRTADFLTLIAPYYRFSRGSMRVRGDFGTYQSVVTAPRLTPPVIVCTAKTANNIGILGADASVSPNLFGGDFINADSQFWKYLLPAWQSSPMIPHHYCVTTSPADTTLLGRHTALSLRGYNWPPSTSPLIRLSRQPADDYELISFIGPPLFTLSVS